MYCFIIHMNLAIGSKVTRSSIIRPVVNVNRGILIIDQFKIDLSFRVEAGTPDRREASLSVIGSSVDISATNLYRGRDAAQTNAEPRLTRFS